MKDLHTMEKILNEKAKEISAEGNPALDAQNSVIMGDKRMTLDEPMTEVKADPLR